MIGHEEMNTELSCLDITCDDRILCAGTETDEDDDSFLVFWYVFSRCLFFLCNVYTSTRMVIVYLYEHNANKIINEKMQFTVLSNLLCVFQGFTKK